MAKKDFIIIASVLMLILTACKQGDGSGGSPTSPFIGQDTTGMKMEFEPGEPPTEVSDEKIPFKVTVKLTNTGEQKVGKQDVLVGLAGFSPNLFGAQVTDVVNLAPADDLEPNLRDSEGKIIDGTTTTVTFPPGEKFFESQKFVGNTVFPIRAEACFKYKNRANTNGLCILRDFVDIDSTDLCNPKESKQIFSSGGPVQITNFKQSVQGTDKIIFFFDVVHKGNGNLFKPAGGNTNDKPVCPMDDFRLKNLNEDRVMVTVKLRQDIQGGLSCNLDEAGRTTGVVKLESGTKTIRCTLDLAGKHATDYTDLVDVEADYNYRIIKETSILFTHQPTFG